MQAQSTKEREMTKSKTFLTKYYSSKAASKKSAATPLPNSNISAIKAMAFELDLAILDNNSYYIFFLVIRER